MASKQLTLSIVWLLFGPIVFGQDEPDAQQLQALRPRGRIRIADMQAPQPPSPPTMLAHGPISWPEYGPMIPPLPGPMPMPASSTVHTHIPLLREHREGPAADAVAPSNGVVYGNWRPEQPIQPDEDEAQPKQRKYGRLEAMLMGLPADDVAGETHERSGEEHSAESERYTPAVGYQNPYARRDSFERVQEPHGRWRIPTSNVPRRPAEPPIVEVVRMNATDPAMRAMAKQINESVETTTTKRQSVQTTEDNWMPLPYPYPAQNSESTLPVHVAVAPKESSTQAPTMSSSLDTDATTVALNWPTDFLDTTSSSTARPSTEAGDSSTSIDRVDHVDSIDRIDDDVDDYKYYEESPNSAQMHNELSVPETGQQPQLPLNITRVGIPYEDRNSAEEPTICVPLTVTETAADSATALVVEVERVYCFPLPKVEIKTGQVRQVLPQPTTDNGQSTEDNKAPAGSTDQVEPSQTAGASRTTSYILLLAIWSCFCTRF